MKQKRSIRNGRPLLYATGIAGSRRFGFIVRRCLASAAPLLIIFSGCTSNLPPQGYIAYYESNKSNFSKTFDRNGVRATIAYVPAEYYAARQMQFDSSLSSEDAVRRFGNSLNFLVVVKGADSAATPLTDRGGMDGFAENIQKSTFGHEQDVFLLNGADTVKALFCNFDRNWGLAGEDAFCLGFSRTTCEKNIMKYHLIFRDVIPEFGTIDIPVKDIIKRGKRLKG
jgi:hypothetical protein